MTRCAALLRVRPEERERHNDGHSKSEREDRSESAPAFPLRATPAIAATTNITIPANCNAERSTAAWRSSTRDVVLHEKPVSRTRPARWWEATPHRKQTAPRPTISAYGHAGRCGAAATTPPIAPTAKGGGRERAHLHADARLALVRPRADQRADIAVGAAQPVIDESRHGGESRPRARRPFSRPPPRRRPRAPSRTPPRRPALASADARARSCVHLLLRGMQPTSPLEGVLSP